MSNKCVYAHYDNKGNLFYIGLGSLKRAYSRFSRSIKWMSRAKEGFSVRVLYKNIPEFWASIIEKAIIEYHYEDLVNYCKGGMLSDHWTNHITKEEHPMYGRKSEKASKRMTEWNKVRKGEKSPTYGKKRPDLVERNKKCRKPIMCWETKEVFKSITEANNVFETTSIRSKTINDPNRYSKGYRFVYYEDYLKYGEDLYSTLKNTK